MIQAILKTNGTFMNFGSLWLYPRQAINQAFAKMFARLVVAVVSLSVPAYCFADQTLSVLQSAERWDDIAKMRFQIAKDHELQGEKVFKQNGVNSFETVGDVLDFYGDEKVLAAENYQKASQNWEKAAQAYQSVSDSIKARKARENASLSLDAAKRTISDAIDLHLRAKEQYVAANNLNKQIQAHEKAASNFERLMEMK
jgi:hypothetical protein